jgi:hypothetical protein
MSTKISNRSLVVLKLPTNVPELIKTGQSIVQAMTGNAFFASPNPPLSKVGGYLATLTATETATKTRAKGTVEARNAARTDVVGALHGLKAYVQEISDAGGDQGPAIIASAGMSVKRTSAPIKPVFAAHPGATSGSVKLVAKAAGHRASYEWQWSSDGGKTWTTAPATLQAKTVIAGLPVATSCIFRYRAVTKTGEGDWSQLVTLVVK